MSVGVISPFDHRKVYGSVPPLGIATALPVDPPPHTTSSERISIESGTRSLMVTLALVEQALASWMVTVYMPGGTPAMLGVVAPVDQTYVYGPVPPVAVAVAVPVVLASHVRPSEVISAARGVTVVAEVEASPVQPSAVTTWTVASTVDPAGSETARSPVQSSLAPTTAPPLAKVQWQVAPSTL